MTANDSTTLDERVERRWRRRNSVGSCIPDRTPFTPKTRSPLLKMDVNNDGDQQHKEIVVIDDDEGSQQHKEVILVDDDDGGQQHKEIVVVDDNAADQQHKEIVVDDDGGGGGDSDVGQDEQHASDDDDDFFDPDYKLFLDNLVQFGKSYAIKLANHVVHYEEDDVDKDEEEARLRPRPGELQEVEEEEEEVVYEEYAKFLDWIEEKQGLAQSVCDIDGKEEDIVVQGEEAENYSMDGNDIVMVDRDYARLLDWVEEKEVVHCSGGGCVAIGGSKRTEDKEEDYNGGNAGLADDAVKVDESMEGNRKLVEDGDGDGDEPSCYILEQDSHTDQFIDVDSGGNIGEGTKFREKLMETLRKPYDEKEYISKKNEIYLKKRMDRHRELRNNSLKLCPINRLGNSYIDTYPEVGRRIEEAAHDKVRALSIMRGFFYWLKNLTQEGAFRPWQDKQIMLGSSF